jgi:hypothetical protein
MIRRISWMILLAPMLAVTGCEGGRDRPPPTRVQVVHAAPSYDTLLFLRVESQFSELGFRGQSSHTFDEDTYRFNVESLPPFSGQPQRIKSFEKQVLNGTDYTFILTEINDLLDVLVVERPTYRVDATTSSGLVVHAGPDLPPLAMYVVPPGTSLDTATPIGIVGFTESAQPVPLSEGTYEVVLTAANDPTDVRLHSPPFPVSGLNENLFVILSEAGQGIADLGVLRVHAQAQFLLDRDMPSLTRVLNVGANRQPRDLYVGEELNEPLIAGAEYGVMTDYATTAAGDVTFTITPQDNVGALELQFVTPTIAGRMHTMMISGQPGEGSLSAGYVTDDRRRLFDRGRVRFANGTNQFEGVLDMYLVPAGTPTDSLGFPVALSSPGFSSVINYPAGEYELYVWFGDSSGSFVAGPVAVSIEAGELYELYVLDGETSSDAEVLLLD